MLLINIAGILLIALIVWWFWLYHPAATDAGDSDRVITVDSGTYLPARIKVSADTPVSLRFLRKDPSPCAEMVIFPDLQISETLPLNTLKVVQLPALATGEYSFHCQMQMYRGTVVVEA